MDELEGGMKLGRICNYLCATNRPASATFAMAIIACELRSSDPVSARDLESGCLSTIEAFGKSAIFGHPDAKY